MEVKSNNVKIDNSNKNPKRDSKTVTKTLTSQTSKAAD